MPVVSTQPCIGCTRNSDQDFSYLAEGKIVFDWHYGGDKGCWCRDCFNLWRTKFKPKLSSVLFSRWIKDNRLEYLGFLLAFLTLKFEGFSMWSCRGSMPVSGCFVRFQLIWLSISLRRCGLHRGWAWHC